jgi:hypothetical protein
MMEYFCQQIYRDARITSIYEGTTQLQVVAAIRYVTNGAYLALMRDYEAVPAAPEFASLIERAKAMADKGFLFYFTNNGVWLTDNVPPEYISVNSYN